MKFLEKIFYCKNKNENGIFRKVINILGIKIKIKIYKKTINGSNNMVILFDNNSQFKVKNYLKDIKINIKGNNNTIMLNSNILKKSHNILININGNDNYINVGDVNSIALTTLVTGNSHKFVINDTIYDINLFVVMGQSRNNKYSTNNSIEIGKNISILGAKIFSFKCNTSLTIGEDCMLSDDIYIQTSDGHMILNNEGDVLNNKAYHIKIGNHVWIGRRAYIFKNTKIPNGCIIGANSFVSSKFYQNNSVIAGIPAKIIKENIKWNRESIY